MVSCPGTTEAEPAVGTSLHVAQEPGPGGGTVQHREHHHKATGEAAESDLTIPSVGAKSSMEVAGDLQIRRLNTLSLSLMPEVVTTPAVTSGGKSRNGDSETCLLPHL